MIIKERIPRQGYTLIWIHDVSNDEEWRDSTNKRDVGIVDDDRTYGFFEPDTKLSDIYKIRY